MSATDTAEDQIAAVLDAPETPSGFSMALSDDQKDIRDWVHGFAEQVVRPAAAEWDEREETPWPIIAEAAKIGLYGYEALAQFFADESGLTLPIVNEELFWGDAGIGMAIMGTSLAVAAIFGQGTGEQAGEWIPQCFGSESEPASGSEAQKAPSLTSSALPKHCGIHSPICSGVPCPKIAATASEVPMIAIPMPASPQNSSSLAIGRVRPVSSAQNWPSASKL
jgi:hypothetical protein